MNKEVPTKFGKSSWSSRFTLDSVLSECSCYILIRRIALCFQSSTIRSITSTLISRDAKSLSHSGEISMKLGKIFIMWENIAGKVSFVQGHRSNVEVTAKSNALFQLDFHWLMAVALLSIWQRQTDWWCDVKVHLLISYFEIFQNQSCVCCAGYSAALHCLHNVHSTHTPVQKFNDWYKSPAYDCNLQVLGLWVRKFSWCQSFLQFVK